MRRLTVLCALLSALPVLGSGRRVAGVEGAGHRAHDLGAWWYHRVSSGADGHLMIDDKFAPLADQIRAALQASATVPSPS
ncbi:MAG: hypothetical protein VCF24_01795 [Candidatus Latescibacterota bacterium]